MLYIDMKHLCACPKAIPQVLQPAKWRGGEACAGKRSISHFGLLRVKGLIPSRLRHGNIWKPFFSVFCLQNILIDCKIPSGTLIMRTLILTGLRFYYHYQFLDKVWNQDSIFQIFWKAMFFYKKLTQAILFFIRIFVRT